MRVTKRAKRLLTIGTNSNHEAILVVTAKLIRENPGNFVFKVRLGELVAFIAPFTEAEFTLKTASRRFPRWLALSTQRSDVWDLRLEKNCSFSTEIPIYGDLNEGFCC